jgi:predicted Zn-dependent peptidase
VIRQLDSNSGMASQLTYFHVNYGNWRKLVTGLEEINKVTEDDVQRIARQYFSANTRTVTYSVKPKTEVAK